MWNLHLATSVTPNKKSAPRQSALGYQWAARKNGRRSGKEGWWLGTELSTPRVTVNITMLIRHFRATSGTCMTRLAFGWVFQAEFEKDDTTTRSTPEHGDNCLEVITEVLKLASGLMDESNGVGKSGWRWMEVRQRRYLGEHNLWDVLFAQKEQRERCKDILPKTKMVTKDGDEHKAGFSGAYLLNVTAVEKVQWFRARADMERWIEEIDLLEEELRRLERACHRMADVWKEMSTTVNPKYKYTDPIHSLRDISNGHIAYALQKSKMYEEMGVRAKRSLLNAGGQYLQPDESLSEYVRRRRPVTEIDWDKASA
ncbi:hypothetical protein CPC08DRAFT_726717 [Agrocybe pediades]|nr:hypothetical protein CPC08DRAFT_726717 [Agrocybe pediades]